MQAQWQPSYSPEGFEGPSFRLGGFVAAARKDEPWIHWHLFRVLPDEMLVQLWRVELTLEWNGGESVVFPREWADKAIAQAEGR